MAVIDIAGFVAELKDHCIDHGFHVHDERYFFETYSLRQSWEVDVHPEDACGGPLDLHLALEADPRLLLAFEDTVLDMGADPAEPEDTFRIPLHFNWALPPLEGSPDLLVLAAELAGLGRSTLPLDVSAISSYMALGESSENRLSIVGKVEVSLADIVMGRQQLCDELDRAKDVSAFLVENASEWLGET